MKKFPEQPCDRPAWATFQVRVDKVQNIAIASTPSEELARHIRNNPALHFGGDEFEVTAYIAVPDDSSRGMAHGNQLGTRNQELINNLRSPGYESLTARMLGKTATELITFIG